MSIQQVKAEKKTIYYAARDVIEAVRNLVLQVEEMEETVLRKELPQEEMSDSEVKELDNALKEMREGGQAIPIEEFTRKHHPSVRSERQTTS